jgi:hypothetical protein
MNTRAIAIAAGLLLLAGGAVGVKAAVDAQRPRGDDIDQIRRMLYEGERAAERRDASTINRFISEDYRDDLGMSDTSLKYQIRDYLKRTAVIELTVPSESIRVEVDAGGRSARAQFRVFSRSRSQGNTFANEFDMSLSLAKERVYYYWIFPGEEWRVTAAEGYTGMEAGF